MMNNKTLIMLVVLLNSMICLAQEPTRTVKLHDLCANLPIEGITADLFLIVNNSKHIAISTNEPISYHHLWRTDSTMESGVDEYIVNIITVKGKGITYFENNGKIRLAILDFKKNRKVKIQLLGSLSVLLSCKLKMEELVQLSNEEPPIPIPYTHSPFNTKRKTYPANRVYYEIVYFTGENEGCTLIHLYFDTKKCLRLMTIDYYNEDIVTHRKFPQKKSV